MHLFISFVHDCTFVLECEKLKNILLLLLFFLMSGSLSVVLGKISTLSSSNLLCIQLESAGAYISLTYFLSQIFAVLLAFMEVKQDCLQLIFFILELCT